MRILHLAYSNTAGVPGRWAEAHRAYGIEADLVIEIPDEYEYGTEAIVERWSGVGEPFERVRELAERADAIMAYDSPFYLVAALGFGKPVLYRAFGSHARGNVERVRALLRSPLVRRATAGTGDLALALGIPLAGGPFPMLERAEPRGLVACHSPSNRQLKGTAAIERVTRGTGWELDVVEDVSHAEVLERKHEAALVIDQFGDPPHPDGIGVSAIEAMAMGLPVIGRASRPVRALYRERLCPAVLIEGVVEFQAELAALAVNEERRQALGEDGRAWVARFHGSGRALEDLEALGACTELVAA